MEFDGLIGNPRWQQFCEAMALHFLENVEGGTLFGNKVNEEASSLLALSEILLETKKHTKILHDIHRDCSRSLLNWRGGPR